MIKQAGHEVLTCYPFEDTLSRLNRDSSFTHVNYKMNTADLIGIFGVVCYQIAYAGMQLGLLQREDRSYLILNLFGPCCLLYSLLFHFNMAAAISQVLWLIWSCVGMAKVSLTRRQASIVAMGSDLSLIRRRGRSPRLRNTQFWLRCRFSENSREEMTRKSSE